MVSYFRFVLRHRFTVLAILLAITVVAGFAMTRGEIGSSLGKLFLGANFPFEPVSRGRRGKLISGCLANLLA